MTQEQEQELRKRQQDRLATIAAFQKLFAQKEAELVLKNLSKEGYENELTFVKDDPYGSAFNSGKRYMILHIRKILNEKQEKPKQKKAKLKGEVK